MGGAGVQQTLELGCASTIPFSLDSSESAPRCATHTWFWLSTATLVTEPSTHVSLGNGCGQSGTTRYDGAAAPRPCARAAGCWPAATYPAMPTAVRAALPIC